MAASAASVFEVRSTATAGNVNGGAFVAGASGVDYSQQDTAQYALTGVTSAGAGNTILSASAAADMVGNFIYVVSGTNFTTSMRFEITAVSAGVSITCATNKVGASISTGVGATGVMNVGGALSLGAANDTTSLNEMAPGNTLYIKAGTYTLGSAITGLTSGTGLLPIKYIGYTTTRGDNPTLASNMPVLDSGTNSFAFPAGISTSGIVFTSTNASGCVSAAGNIHYNCKFINTSTTADRYAMNAATGSGFYGCEFVSYRGRGLGLLGDYSTVTNCYFHHCNEGLYITSGNSIGAPIVGNIFEGCVSSAIRYTATNINNDVIANNTIYGSTADLGTGILMTNANRAKIIVNNIFYGLTTGISVTGGGTILGHRDNNNCFFSCGTNASSYTLNGTVVTTDPAFTDVGELSGSGGVVAGSVLTVASATGIVPLQDYVYIVSGTGATAGVYKIVSNVGTALTLDIAPGGSGSDIVYRIITGHDFAVGTNMRALGYPGVFPATVAALSTGFTDLGAVQREEVAAAGGSGGSGSKHLGPARFG